MRLRRPTRGESGWLLAGYLGLAGFVALERIYRSNGLPVNLRQGDSDRGSTRLIVLAYGFGAELPWIASRLSAPQLSAAVAPAGLVLEAAGLGLRAWSMRELGRFYTRTLLVDAGEQQLVESGPYRLIRHPGYTGSLLIWIGFTLTSRRPSVIAPVLGMLGGAYVRRMAAEERMLRRDVAGYAAYMQRTRKIIPLVW